MIDFLGDVFAFIVDNWWGSTGFLARTVEHVWLSALATGLAAIVAMPPAMALGHLGKGTFLAVSVVNIGRAIPSFGIVAIALPISIELGLGLGFWPTFIALFALALPPIFTNTLTGVREVDPALVEAASGMGMTGAEILAKVELPIAMPVMLAGLRVSAVQVVATATLGALVGWGGLGRYVIDGFSTGDNVEVFAGGLGVALLAIATEVLFAFAERRLVARPLRVATQAA